MNITYWSDYACPYCYIGETNLKKAADELGLDDLEIEMKAFELDPEAETVATGNIVDHFADKYRISTEQALDKINSISIMARESGIEDFDYSKVRKTNTFDAHRLTKLAADKGLGEEAAQKLYEAYFVDRKELANPETLIEVALDLGLDINEVKALLDSDLYAQEVRIDEQVARQNGISAVPFFIIDGKYAVPGALPVEQMKEVLTQIIE